MARHMKKRTDKRGLPPGALVHVGDCKPAEIKITAIEFDDNSCSEIELKSWDEFKRPDGNRIAWINVCGVHDPDVIKKIGDSFNIHPLSLEDIMNTDHITKLNHINDYLLVIMKSFVFEELSGDDLVPRQVSIILGAGYVISFQETSCDIFKPIREHLRADKALFHKMGAGYLAYCLLDVIVDNYFEVLENVDDEIFELEEATTVSHGPEYLRIIQKLRRRTVIVRRAAWPLREVINSLAKKGTALIPESSTIYFNDIYDHIVQIIDITESFREILSNIFDIYLSNISNKINEVMKVLTIVATIMMPLTLIVGLYGMNFDYMPELKWHWGYPAVIFAMILVSAGMIAFFKKKKWM